MHIQLTLITNSDSRNATAGKTLFQQTRGESTRNDRQTHNSAASARCSAFSTSHSVITRRRAACTHAHAVNTHVTRTLWRHTHAVSTAYCQHLRHTHAVTSHAGCDFTHTLSALLTVNTYVTRTLWRHTHAVTSHTRCQHCLLSTLTSHPRCDVSWSVSEWQTCPALWCRPREL